MRVDTRMTSSFFMIGDETQLTKNDSKFEVTILDHIFRIVWMSQMRMT